MKPLIAKAVFAVTVTTGVFAACGALESKTADDIVNTHRLLCDALVLERAEALGIPVSEALSYGWHQSCMLDIGKAVQAVRALKPPVSVIEPVAPPATTE